MMGLGLGAGWLVGILLNGLADFLPRYSSSEIKHRSNSARWAMPAVIQWMSLIVSRKTGASLPAAVRLNLAVELVTAGLFAVIWSQAAPLLILIKLSLLGAFLILVAVIDLRYRLVLNILVFPAMAATLFVRGVTPGTNLLTVLLGGAFGFAIFALAAFVRPGQLGGGDIKLATLIGLIFGFPNALWALLIGVLAGGAVSLWLLTSRRGTAQSQMPYAPFLALGALVALFYNPVPVLILRFAGY